MPTSEVIDQATFARFLDSLGGDVEFLNELVDEYLSSTPGLFDRMQQAIATGEAPALQRAAHSLKTGSATFGALAFAAQCKELEDLAKIGVLDCAEEKYTALAAAYPQVAAALQKQVETASS